MEAKRSPRLWLMWLVACLLVAWWPLTAPPVQRLVRNGYLAREWALYYSQPFYRFVHLLPKPLQRPYWVYWQLWRSDLWPD